MHYSGTDMKEFMATAPILIIAGSTGVLFIVDTAVLNFALGATGITLVIWCVKTIRSCKARNKRLDLLQTRKSRREYVAGNRTGVSGTP